MENFLTDNNIEVRPVPFGLDPANKPTQEDVLATQEELGQVGFSLPQDYIDFCRIFGGGTLGRTKIFTFHGNSISPIDLRFHTTRIQTKFADPEFKFYHTFPMGNLIVFGLDLREHLWFGWCHSVEKYAGRVFVFQEDEKAPPPKAIADNFTEFIQEVSIGNRMKEEQIRRLLEPRNLTPGDYENFDNDSDDDDPDYVPPQTFIPFPQPRGF